MDFYAKINVGALSAALRLVRPAVKKRHTIPVLTMVKLIGSGTKVQVSGSNLDMQISTSVEASDTTTGSIGLPMRRLIALLNAVAADEEVTISVNGNVANVSCGHMSAAIIGMPYDVPNICSDGKEVFNIDLAEGVLPDLIGSVRYAVSSEETRYYLNGVALEIGKNKIIAVATDGHRLSLQKISCTCPPFKKTLIIPTETVDVASSLSRGRQVAFIGLESVKGAVAAIRFDLEGGIIISSKLIDGTYPDWRRVLPPDGGRAKVAIDIREALLAIRASIKDRAIRISQEGTNIALSQEYFDGEKWSKLLPSSSSGNYEVQTFGMNPEYLRDTLVSIARVRGRRHVNAFVTDPGAPVMFRPDDGVSEETHVLMPMRI